MKSDLPNPTPATPAVLNYTCFCGCTDFWIQKPKKHWTIVCMRCKCQRKIGSPGISVDEYDVDIPFKEHE